MSDKSENIISTSDTKSQTSSVRRAALERQDQTLIGIEAIFGIIGFNDPSALIGAPPPADAQEKSDHDLALSLQMELYGAAPSDTLRVTGTTSNNLPEQEVVKEVLAAIVDTVVANADKRNDAYPTGTEILTCSPDFKQYRTCLAGFIRKIAEKKIHQLCETDPFSRKANYPGVNSYITSLTLYWVDFLQLILWIKAAETFLATTWSQGASEICALLGISRGTLERALKTAIHWPYFVQLTCHLACPTAFNCKELPKSRRARKNSRDNKHFRLPKRDMERKENLLFLNLPSSHPARLLKDIGKLKVTLARSANIAKPNMLPKHVLKARLTQARNPKVTNLYKAWIKKCKLRNSKYVSDIIREALRREADSLKLLPVTIPNKLLPGMTPLSSQLFDALSYSYGFATPHWLTLPRWSTSSTSAINQNLQPLRLPATVYSVAMTPFELSKFGDLPDCIEANSRVFAYQDLIPQLSKPRVVDRRRPQPHSAGTYVTYSPTDAYGLNIHSVCSLCALLTNSATYLTQNTNNTDKND